MTVPTGTLHPAPLLAPWPGTPHGGAPLAGELRGGDLWGDSDAGLDGVAGRLVPRAADPLAWDPHTGDCLVVMPNILAALSKSESESRNLVIAYSQMWPVFDRHWTAMVIPLCYQFF